MQGLTKRRNSSPPHRLTATLIRISVRDEWLYADNEQEQRVNVSCWIVGSCNGDRSYPALRRLSVVFDRVGFVAK
jgi:hypothetical protein